MLIAAEQQGSIWPTIGMFALLFGLMYLLFIRPQSKRRKEAERMQKQLGPGDKIITIGGMHGTVQEADNDSVLLEIAPGVSARYARQAIARVVERQTAASDEAPAEEDSVSGPVEETKKTS